MAVFKPTLNWQTIQDKQLKALESLNTVCEKEFSVQEEIRDLLINDIPNTILQSASLQIEALNSLLSGREFKELTEDINDYQDSMTAGLDRSINYTKQSSNDIIEGLKDIDDSLENNMAGPGKFDELIDEVKSIGRRAWGHLVTAAEKLTEAYNDTIKYVGLSGPDAQKFRSDILRGVSDLNSELGGLGSKLSPSEALNTMIAISNQTNIANVKTLKNLLAPILLAQETTNLNLQELAELGQTFYSRYNFNSKSIEQIVNHVRNLSEDRNVDKDALLRATKVLETRFGLLFNGDQDKMLKSVESLTNGIAWLEHNGVDHNNIVEDLNTMLGDNPLAKSDLYVKYAGSYQEIEKLARTSGKQAEAIELMMKSIGGRNAVTAEAGLGINPREADQARLLMQMLAKGQTESLQDFIDNTKQATSRERAADKFVSLEQQMLNKMDNIAQYLSKIQETLGIGVSDVALILSTAGNLLAALGVTSMAGGGGIAGLLSKAGPALGVGAAIAALTGVVVSIKDSYDKANKEKIDAYNETIGSLGPLSAGQGVSANTIVEVDKETGQVNTKLKMSQSDQSSIDLKASERAIEEALISKTESIDKEYEKGDSWWRKVFGFGSEGKKHEYVPILGGILDDYERYRRKTEQEDLADIQKEFLSFSNNLSAENKKLYNAYLSKGLIRGDDTDQMRFFMQNFSEFSDMSKKGLASEVSEEGLQNPKPRKEILGYDVGANYIPNNQLAYLHKGEAVVPAKYNPANNMNELERLRKKEAETDSSDDKALLKIIYLLSDMRNFMKYWKSDSDMKYRIGGSNNFVPELFKRALGGYNAGGNATYPAGGTNNYPTVPITPYRP